MATEKLTLPLKKQWFDMIRTGGKKEEYREVKPYWISRLALLIQRNAGVPYWCMPRKYDLIEFTIGYPKKNDPTRRLIFKNPRIRIDKGRPEWGAEKDKTYFVITWEDIE